MDVQVEILGEYRLFRAVPVRFHRWCRGLANLPL